MYQVKQHPIYKRGLQHGFWWGTFNAALIVGIYVIGGLVYRGCVL